MIKKLTLSVLLAVSCSYYAQSIKYGLTANGHLSRIDNIHDNSKGRIAGAVGAFVSIPLYPEDLFRSNYYFIQPQVEYSMQGETAETPPFPTQKFFNDYISAAVYFKYFINKGTFSTNFFVFAGPKVEYLLSENRNVTPEYDLAYSGVNLNDDIKSLGFGVSGGVGYALTDQFEIFARFDQGLTKVYPNNPNDTYNSQAALGVNYIFKTK